MKPADFIQLCAAGGLSSVYFDMRPGHRREFEAGPHAGFVEGAPGWFAAEIKTEDRSFRAEVSAEEVPRGSTPDWGEMDHLQRLCRNMVPNQCLLTVQREHKDGRVVDRILILTSRWVGDPPTDGEAVMLALCLS